MKFCRKLNFKEMHISKPLNMPKGMKKIIYHEKLKKFIIFFYYIDEFYSLRGTFWCIESGAIQCFSKGGP